MSSRSGYTDDVDQSDMALWRGRVASAIRGKRGQKLLRDLRDGLDAMPEKRLIPSALVTPEGCCSLGCVAKHRAVDVSDISPDDFEDDPDWCNGSLSERLNISECMVAEVEYENDEGGWKETPEQRWTRMRKWVHRHLNDADPVGVALCA